MVILLVSVLKVATFVCVVVPPESVPLRYHWIVAFVGKVFAATAFCCVFPLTVMLW